MSNSPNTTRPSSPTNNGHHFTDNAGNDTHLTFDNSGNITYTITDASGNAEYTLTDVNGSTTVVDASGNTTYTFTDADGHITKRTIPDVPGIVIPPIITYSLNQTVDASGTEIITQQGQSANHSTVTHISFTTTDKSSDVQITENLGEVIEVYDDDSDPNSPAGLLVNQIKLYASEIKCSDFHGKGTIDDYTELFVAAGKIANESKQMQLNIDIDGFNEFGQAADDLSALFSGFIVKLNNVNIINDISFLTAISIALGKIVNLSKIFGQFKETIISTTTFQVPKSTHDTQIVIQGVMDEINCAMGYISYFVDPSGSTCIPIDAKLSQDEADIISKAVSTIDSWNLICEQGVSVAMNNNPDIQYISNASSQLKTTATNLQAATQKLKNKLAVFSFSS